jgi:hypothetical protein
MMVSQSFAAHLIWSVIASPLFVLVALYLIWHAVFDVFCACFTPCGAADTNVNLSDWFAFALYIVSTVRSGFNPNSELALVHCHVSS